MAGILYYLARRFPVADLLPQHEIEAQAQAVSWMSFLASTVHPARRQGLDHARGIYALADQRLGDRDWAIGTYSIADIHLFRLFWRFRGSPGVDTSALSSLNAHYARMLERPAVRKTIADETALGYGLPA